MKNIVLFGPPGAGKGTQSEKIIEKYGFLHLSTGDLLRAEIANNTKLGLDAKTFMDAGKLVPDEVLIGMVANKIENNLEVAGFIFDGFPRTVVQAEALDVMLEQKHLKIAGMIALEVEETELTKRILERGKTSGRADDQNEELVKKRVEEYNTKTAPVANHYKAQSKFASINGIGEIDAIFTNISNVIDSY